MATGVGGGRRVGQQLRSYLRAVMWLARDMVRQFPSRVVAVTALHVIGVSIGAVTIGLVVLLVHVLAEEGAVDIGAVSLPAVSGPMAGVLGGAIGVLALASACSVYFAEVAIVRLVVRYQRECDRRLFRIARDPHCRGWGVLLDGPAAKQLRVLQSRGCKSLALNARWLMRSVLPCAMLIVAGSALVVTDWRLTLLLLPLGAVYLLPLYFINIGAAKTQRKYRSTGQPVQRAVSHALQSAAGTGESTSSGGADERLLDDSSYVEAGLLSLKRRLLPEQIRLLNVVFFVAATAVLFIYAAFQSGSVDWSWSRLLLYIIALRFTISGLQQVASTFARLSRFYPEYRPYIDFVEGAAALRAQHPSSWRETAELPRRMRIRCGKGSVADSSPRLDVDRPGPLWVVLPWKPSRADLEAVARRLEQRSPDIANLFAVSRFDASRQRDRPDCSWLAELRDGDRDQLRERFRAIGVLEETEPWLEDQHLKQQRSTDGLSREANWALRAGAILLNSQAAFLTAESLRRMPVNVIEQLAELFVDRLVVLVTDQPDEPLNPPQTAWPPDTARVMVCGYRDMLGSGDLSWLADQLAAVSDMLNACREQRGVQNGASAADEVDQSET